MTDVLVLCYHALSPSWPAELALHPDAFERQVTGLLHHGWTATTFERAVLDPPTPRTLAVTFDDAFASVREYALPVLTRLGAPATVFAPTSYLDSRTLIWDGIDHWRDSPHADELRSMSWDELADLTSRGWQIGSHTRTHPHLTRLDDRALDSELAGSREECQARLGEAPRTIAYPYGDVDQRVADRARAAGYRAGAALSSRLERLGPLRHPRVGIYHVDASWRFALKVARPMRALRASALWK